jgi:TusA-related sulfurtransferase
MNAVIEPPPGVAVTLDMTGAACPLPLLGAKRLLDDLPDGQPLRLISDCPGTGDDLRAWTAATRHQLVATEPLDGRRTAYTLRRALAAGRNPANVTLDLRGAVCPDPIVEARRLLDTLPAGDVLVLLSDCPGARADVAAWSDATGIELIDTFQSPGGAVEFYLRRRFTDNEDPDGD